MVSNRPKSPSLGLVPSGRIASFVTFLEDGLFINRVHGGAPQGLYATYHDYRGISACSTAIGTPWDDFTCRKSDKFDSADETGRANVPPSSSRRLN